MMLNKHLSLKFSPIIFYGSKTNNFDQDNSKAYYIIILAEVYIDIFYGNL